MVPALDRVDTPEAAHQPEVAVALENMAEDPHKFCDFCRWTWLLIMPTNKPGTPTSPKQQCSHSTPRLRPKMLMARRCVRSRVSNVIVMIECQYDWFATIFHFTEEKIRPGYVMQRIGHDTLQSREDQPQEKKLILQGPRFRSGPSLLASR